MKRPRRSIPVKAIVGLIRSEWALRYRLAEQPRDVRVGAVRLTLDSEWATPTVRRAIYEGWYEAPELEVLQRTLRPDDVYLEAGAGLGVLTTCACRIVGDINVTAFEADPRLATVTAETARRNGFAPTVINAALGAQDGEATFYVRDDFWTSSLVPSVAARPTTVPVRSLSRELDRCRPTYLMIDIEGGEIDLLRVPLPAHVRAVCVETHATAVGHDAVQRLLVGLIADGFQLDLVASLHGVAFLSRPRD